MSGATMADLRNAFKTRVISMVRDLEDIGHFQNRDELPKNQRAVLDRVLGETLPDLEWPDVLFELSRILRNLHGNKTIVLIDEYDTPITNITKSPFALEVFHPKSDIVHFSFPFQAHAFLRSVYEKLLKVGVFMLTRCFVNLKLQNNEHIGGALLVGILPIATLLSGINNVKVRLFTYTSVRCCNISF